MDVSLFQEWGVEGAYALIALLFFLILRHEQKCKEDRQEMKATLQRIEDRLDRGAVVMARMDERLKALEQSRK